MAINIEWQVKPPSKVRRTSERRAELVRAIPSEEEEGEANEEKSQLFPRICQQSSVLMFN